MRNEKVGVMLIPQEGPTNAYKISIRKLKEKKNSVSK
jgi:hypothetical protein